MRRHRYDARIEADAALASFAEQRGWAYRCVSGAGSPLVSGSEFTSGMVVSGVKAGSPSMRTSVSRSSFHAFSKGSTAQRPAASRSAMLSFLGRVA